ncbi:MAG TPA: metallophosphoesterase, partial [Kofleriaceae bacterium]|nr:metallophosphoesterase [Kofleriaceae bacterium]
MRLMLLGDAHITQSGRATPAFLRVVAEVARMHPDAVVMLGDLTSGDPADGVPLPKVQSWWAAMKEALAPLRAAGVPVLPIPGNHDQYTAVHRQAYEEAWSQLAQQVAP